MHTDQETLTWTWTQHDTLITQLLKHVRKARNNVSVVCVI